MIQVYYSSYEYVNWFDVVIVFILAVNGRASSDWFIAKNIEWLRTKLTIVLTGKDWKGELTLLFYWELFCRKFYAHLRRVINFLENCPFGQLMGRPQVYIEHQHIGSELFCRKFRDSSFAYFLASREYTDYFLEIIFQEFERLFIFQEFTQLFILQKFHVSKNCSFFQLILLIIKIEKLIHICIRITYTYIYTYTYT